MNAARAMLEYRDIAVASAGRVMSGRTTTMRSSPPSQTAAAMMCSTSAITAASWFASSPECPCVPIGTSAAIARIATNSVGVHDRTANASTVIVAPATAVSSHVRPLSVSTRNRPSCAPNSGPSPTAGLNVLTNVKKPVVAAATVNSAARDGCHVEGRVELALSCFQGEQRRDERSDHARRGEVHRERGDGQTPPDERVPGRRSRTARRLLRR